MHSRAESSWPPEHGERVHVELERSWRVCGNFVMYPVDLYVSRVTAVSQEGSD